MANPTLLMIRPEPQARAFVDALTAQTGKSPATIFAPIIDICAVQSQELPTNTQFLLFSSVNGVTYYAKNDADRTRPALCVGDTTADAARAVGLTAVSANGTGADLVKLAESTANKQNGPLVYVCGNIVSQDIDGDLAKLGFQTERRVVYEQISLPLSETALSSLRDHVVIPLSSPNTAQFFLSAVGDADLSNVTFICLSARIAACVEATNAKVICAAAPTRSAMIHALGTFL